MRTIVAFIFVIHCCGCAVDLPATRKSAPEKPQPANQGDTLRVGQISRTDAIALAKAHLAGSPHAKLFSTEHFFVGCHAAKGIYTVDFRNVGKMGDEMLPGLWGAGFLVTVDAQTGKILNSNGYKR